MKSRNLCKKKWAQSRSISGRRCSLDWEQDFTQIGGLDPASHPPRFPGLFSAPRESRPGGAPLSRLVRGWPLFPSVIKVRAGRRLPFRFFIHNRKRRIFAPEEAPSPSVFAGLPVFFFGCRGKGGGPPGFSSSPAIFRKRMACRRPPRWAAKLPFPLRPGAPGDHPGDFGRRNGKKGIRAPDRSPEGWKILSFPFRETQRLIEKDRTALV